MTMMKIRDARQCRHEDTVIASIRPYMMTQQFQHLLHYHAARLPTRRNAGRTHTARRRAFAPARHDKTGFSPPSQRAFPSLGFLQDDFVRDFCLPSAVTFGRRLPRRSSFSLIVTEGRAAGFHDISTDITSALVSHDDVMPCRLREANISSMIVHRLSRSLYGYHLR